MKYIMLKVINPLVDRLVPVIFPDFICHSDIAEATQRLLKETYKQESEIYSAGDIDVTTFCSGHSTTLKIGSKLGDTEVINGYDYFHGIV